MPEEFSLEAEGLVTETELLAEEIKEGRIGAGDKDSRPNEVVVDAEYVVAKTELTSVNTAVSFGWQTAGLSYQPSQDCPKMTRKVKVILTLRHCKRERRRGAVEGQEPMKAPHCEREE